MVLWIFAEIRLKTIKLDQKQSKEGLGSWGRGGGRGLPLFYSFELDFIMFDLFVIWSGGRGQPAFDSFELDFTIFDLFVSRLDHNFLLLLSNLGQDIFQNKSKLCLINVWKRLRKYHPPSPLDPKG